MIEPQASRFWHAALKSGLIDAAALEACWNAIPQAKRTADAIDRRLARQTVNSGYLTLWQAQQLLSGRAVGYRIDKYVLLDRIGHGGMGRVYLAKDKRLNRLVALKVLSPERMNNPRALARFLREAKVGAQLQHENLVRIYDEGESNGIRYLVMEYIEGQNVGQLIAEKGPMPYSTAARLARQVALGLEHAQQKGLIHRDVNPWNILVTRDGMAKLTDLGLAIDLGDNDEAVTRDGATVGTFDYISPEQARHSRSVDTRSDIYSLGCTLFHMITGRVPFPQPSLPEKLYAHQLSNAEPVSALVPNVPPELDQVVQRMMKKTPEERFRSPAEVARALEPFVNGAEVGVGAAPTVELVRDPRTATQAVPAGAGQTTTVSPPPDLVEPGSSLPEGTPVPAPERASDGEFAELMPALDFGPALPLSDTLSGVKPKYRLPQIAFEPRRLKVALAAGGAVVLAIAMVATVRSCGPHGTPPAYAGGTPGTSAAKSPANLTSKNGPTETEPPAIAVRWPDGTEKPFDSGDTLADFKDAVQSAASPGAVVLFRNRKPLQIKATRPLTCPGGRLILRAGKNEKPILSVEMAGKDSFLIAKSDSSLELDGLTVEVGYTNPKAPAPPLITAAGNLALNRCIFSTSVPVRGARVANAEGLTTAVTGCLFEGFDPAIQTVAFRGSTVRVTQSMFVPGSMGTEIKGWGIGVSGGGSDGRGQAQRERRLVIDHCTFVGKGVLILEGFTAEAPLQADVKQSVARADALLMWKSPGKEPAKGLKWSGQSNRYDITSAAWVAQAPASPDSIADALPGSPSDLESWSKLMSDDLQASASAITFRAAISATGMHQPSDFALAETANANVGADPAKVGPAGPPPDAK